MLRDHKGFVFLNANILSLLLAAAGAWYLHRAYVSGSWKTDVSAMVEDGKKVFGKKQVTTQPLAQLPVDPDMAAKVEEVLKQYMNSSQVQKVTSPLSLPNTVVEQGAYYGK